MAQKIGRYEIKSELGRGGMATVYHAYDPRFERDVAVKVLPREFLHDPTFRTRFEREAKIIASLDHPAIVSVYDFGEENDQPYFVMRLMTGGSLTDRLSRGAFSVTEASRILNWLAPAIDEAHTRGIIHRDLKPSNILFDQRDDPAIADFGIAKLSEASFALTSRGILGTPAYMSPEQVYGDKVLDGRSDVYSLGVILFEMLTGQQPYQADTPMRLAMKHVNTPVPRILDMQPTLPSACETVLTRAMAKKPESRYSTVSEMATALATTVASGRASPPATLPPTVISTPPKLPKTNRTLIGAGVLALIIVGAIILFAINNGEQDILTSDVRPTDKSVAVSSTDTATPQAIATLEKVATSTPIALLPTNTPIPPTDTPAPTSTRTPTNTPIPPTSTPPSKPTKTSIPPTNTPPSKPTATATPSSKANPGSYSHNFSFDDGKWDIGNWTGQYADADTSLVDGKYRFSVTPHVDGAQYTRCLKGHSFDNFVLSVDAWPIAGPYPLIYGITFRWKGWDDYYRFALSNAGTYRVAVRKDGDFTELVAWTSSVAINNGGNNRIVISAVDSTLNFSVNDQHVITVTDDALSQGQICFLIGHYRDNIATTIDFDNLNITVP